MNLYDMLVSAASENGNQSAVIWNDGDNITYNDFLELVNIIISKIEEKNITNSPIAVALRRTPLLIAAMFAIVASGNYYVPIDLSYPKARIRYILRNSDASALLSDVEEELEFDINKIIHISLEEKKEIAKKVFVNQTLQDNTAYCIYTSGSTGSPKGVMIKEHSLVEFIRNFTDTVATDDCKRVLCSATHAFDIFFVESIFALTKGMTVVLAKEEDGRNPKKLLEIIEHYDVDLIQMTPSRMRMIAHYDPELKNFKNLKCILIGGERFPEELLDKLKKVCSARIYNVYGPTETTIWCSVCELTHRENVTIGKPIPGVDFIIWDNSLQQESEKELGELLIGGNCLADSYFKDVQKTNNSFVWINDKRYFKTGDVVKKDNSEYQILGRTDNQIKYRGYRIELEEIETSAIKYGNIKQCIAYPVMKNDIVDRIILYYTSEGNQDCQEALKQTLNQYLPEYMIPGEFIQVKEFFYTDTGKIDRKRINDLAVIKKQIKYEVKNSLQKEIKELIWKITDVYDDFNPETRMEKIIDSLRFVQLVVEIERKYNIKIEDEMLLKGLRITFSEFVDLLQ